MNDKVIRFWEGGGGELSSNSVLLETLNYTKTSDTLIFLSTKEFANDNKKYSQTMMK